MQNYGGIGRSWGGLLAQTNIHEMQKTKPDVIIQLEHVQRTGLQTLKGPYLAPGLQLVHACVALTKQIRGRTQHLSLRQSSRASAS